jgi:hypothetical protein
MATWEILAWRDIPAMVEARDADGSVTVPLSDRFQALIDAHAMQLGLHESEAYIEQWRRLPGGDRPGSAREAAEAAAAELETRFDELAARLRSGS